jgi:ATP adenylyltransferase
VTLDRLWAGWRGAYVSEAAASAGDDCVLCRITTRGSPEDDAARYVVWRGELTAAVLNAFPYTSGHLMVAPLRHVGEVEDLLADEADELWLAMTDAVRALKGAYRPAGLNMGFNLGRAAGAGVPGHLHAHVLPRWEGDANFMTAVAEVRVMPEALPDTWAKVRAAWPT